MVGMTGFEPATPSPPAKCATRLRHIPALKYNSVAEAILPDACEINVKI